jgi:photosystem II stability/assembly factor-like uncharacterized protein
VRLIFSVVPTPAVVFYKTTDGGKTWNLTGLENTHTIGRIRIHPENTDIVYVASTGHEWTPNEERGLYKTADGGKTWTKILSVNQNTGVYDVVLDPRDPNTLYATTWERMRLKWNDPRTFSDTRNCGVWKSVDGGRNWKEINSACLHLRTAADRYRCFTIKSRCALPAS